MKIHSTAIIHKKAQIDKSVEIGPYSIIGEHVRIGKNTNISSHVVIEGYTTIGAGCHVYSSAVIGSHSQDLKYKQERSYVHIGDNTIIREFVTVNSATGPEAETVIGADCFLMAYGHVAHNCRLGNGVVMANCGTLAGHVTIEDKAIIGGLVAVHQFCCIGTQALIGGCSKVVQDVPPYTIADGHPAKSRTLNSIGLKRNNVSSEGQQQLKKAFKIIFRSGLLIPNALEKINKEISPSKEITHLVEFIKKSERGIC